MLRNAGRVRRVTLAKTYASRAQLPSILICTALAFPSRCSTPIHSLEARLGAAAKIPRTQRRWHSSSTSTFPHTTQSASHTWGQPSGGKRNLWRNCAIFLAGAVASVVCIELTDQPDQELAKLGGILQELSFLIRFQHVVHSPAFEAVMVKSLSERAESPSRAHIADEQAAPAPNHQFDVSTLPDAHDPVLDRTSFLLFLTILKTCWDPSADLRGSVALPTASGPSSQSKLQDQHGFMQHYLDLDPSAAVLVRACLLRVREMVKESLYRGDDDEESTQPSNSADSRHTADPLLSLYNFGSSSRLYKTALDVSIAVRETDVALYRMMLEDALKEKKKLIELAERVSGTLVEMSEEKAEKVKVGEERRESYLDVDT